MSEWIAFERVPYNPLGKFEAPYDGKSFLACIWGNDSAGAWVGQAIYARHYDAEKGIGPSKYEFFYVTQDPENEGWKIRIETEPFPITHWMPLPKPPEDK
jgi:hypothetical protein